MSCFSRRHRWIGAILGGIEGGRPAAWILSLVFVLATVASVLPGAQANAREIEPQDPETSSAQTTGADPLAEIEAMLDRGVALFNSADQPDSIGVFGELIARVDALAPGVDALPALARGLSYRAQARFNLGEEADADADMRRLLQVAPRTRLDPTLVSPKLIELFDALRAEIVGEVALVLYPEAARVVVDGREIETTLEAIALAEGTHTLSVQMLGHTGHQRQIEIAAGETLTVDVTLERSSAIVTVRTDAPGASVTVDGRAVGETVSADPDDPAAAGGATLSFDGLDAGTHNIEITREGYRPHSGQITVEDLVEYRLDPVALRRTVGIVVIQRIPSDADLRIDDRSVDTSAAAGVLEVELVPGVHTISIDGGSLGSFSTDVEVIDRDRHEVDVELRPSVYFLGVVGDDGVGRATVVEALEPVLASGRWNQLALPPLDSAALSGTGLQIDALRTQARGDGPRGAHWRFQATQQQLDGRTPASLYVFAVLSDDLVATHAEIWTFPGGPGPAFGDQIRVALNDSASIAARVDAELLGGGTTFTRPWLGADFIDSLTTTGAVALSVSPTGPAAAAGLSPGDVVMAVDGTAISNTAELQQALDSLAIGARVELALANGSVSVSLARSAQIIDPDSARSPFASVLIAVRQMRAVGDDTVPEWVLALNEAAILLRAGEWEQVVRLLRPLQVPERAGVGASMASYWLGLALSELGSDYASLASDSFERAAADRDGRLLHDDGPLVWPLARARARRLQR